MLLINGPRQSVPKKLAICNRKGDLEDWRQSVLFPFACLAAITALPHSCPLKNLLSRFNASLSGPSSFPSRRRLEMIAPLNPCLPYVGPDLISTFFGSMATCWVPLDSHSSRDFPSVATFSWRRRFTAHRVTWKCLEETVTGMSSNFGNDTSCLGTASLTAGFVDSVLRFLVESRHHVCQKGHNGSTRCLAGRYAMTGDSRQLSKVCSDRAQTNPVLYLLHKRTACQYPAVSYVANIWGRL